MLISMTNTTNTHIPTIVYVEDNAGDAVLVEEALREGNHSAQLMVIDRGDKALRYFQIKATAGDLPPPHCILLDAHLPRVAGSELLRFIRGSRVYDDTPVYIFSSPNDYEDLIQAQVVSKESFITKCNSWDGFLLLGDLLMKSAIAKQNQEIASPTDSNPEVHPEGNLRRPEVRDEHQRP